ncbi:MAG: hypothetical protein IKN25_02775 [Spirochaetales bacterium]|nr:hypothetical protein [Spirochaetales bacterium]
MIENEQDLISAINQSRPNGSMFPGNPLDKVHRQMTGGLGHSGNMSAQDTIIAQVVMADKKVRSAVRELTSALFKLNDKQSAQKLLGEHIIMLNSIFSEFE